MAEELLETVDRLQSRLLENPEPRKVTTAPVEADRLGVKNPDSLPTCDGLFLAAEKGPAAAAAVRKSQPFFKCCVCGPLPCSVLLQFLHVKQNSFVYFFPININDSSSANTMWEDVLKCFALV